MLVGARAVSARTEHPRLLFDKNEIGAIRERAEVAVLKPIAQRLLERAEWQLQAPPIIPSITKRGEPDPVGEVKGIAAARALQGRVLTYCMAHTLTGLKKYRDAAVAEMRRAISDWRIWVDTAHRPPFDLMTGEICLTFGLAYDWLYQDLTPDERRELRQGAERRALQAYLQSSADERRGMFFTARHNWNPVCNGGAAVLALAFEGESDLSTRVLEIAVPAMDHYWNHLAEDGGWDEGTGYWTYGHRYAFISAEALRRSGKPGGAERFRLRGARNTGYFPVIFNPGKKLSASFGDVTSRASDPIFYLLGREYKEPAFIWFQDRAAPPDIKSSSWPQEALSLIWRPTGERWLPEANKNFKPALNSTYVFPSIGWAMMSPRQPDPPYFLAFKNGSLAANHTHLDLNHVSVGFGESMLAVELGSRPYPADYFSSKRYTYYEINTAAHNTVLVGGKGQIPGRKGKLVGPIKGQGFEALVGVADGVYENEAPRVRRHVVFVKNRYWILLDEIQTVQPQSAELRFHTYGVVVEKAPLHWTLEEGQGVLDVLQAPLAEKLSLSVETPVGWIKPVQVLSIKANTPTREHVLITVLHPRMKTAPHLGPAQVRQSEQELILVVGKEQIKFGKTGEGWQVKNVRTN
jgi:hypothetical protein